MFYVVTWIKSFYFLGRPRPDFFWRCFPDGEMNSEMRCTGPIEDVIEGRKSFPSGHSSSINYHVFGILVLNIFIFQIFSIIFVVSFSSLGTMAWWLMGKLHVWSSCRGSSLRLLFTLTPLIVATVIALSRTCDYHHHWQGITFSVNVLL